MHMHWQNLNEKPDGTTGSGWKHGRAWLHLGASYSRTLNVEWRWAAFHTLGVRFDLGAHREATLSLHFGWFSLYLGGDGVLPRWLRPRRAQAWGLTYSRESHHLSYSLGCDPWSWRRGDWRQGGCFVPDVLLGRAKHETTTLRTVETVIPMPEGVYPATVKLTRATWWRPRWPFPLVRYYSAVEIPNGIPFPGKGENAWDCGDDALFGCAAEGTTVEAGVANAVESVLRYRRKYGWTADNERGAA